MPNSIDDADNLRSSFNAYMARARKIPLLTAAQEVSLAKQVRLGGAIGEQARDILITSNLRFVVSIAWKQVRPTVALEDLVQEGNLGLFKAVSKFDETKGFRFLTYARWWINQSIREYLDRNSFAFRVPSSSSQNIHKMNRVLAVLSRDGKQPSDQQVADAMGVEVDFVRDLMQWAKLPVSLHSPLDNEDGESELGDLLQDPEAVNPEDNAITVDFNIKVTGALEKLTEKQRNVIALRFGLDGEGERTLDEISKIYGVTRERIRQIEAKALEILSGGKSGKVLRTLI